MKFVRVVGILMLSAAFGCGEYNREAVESNNQGMQLLRANRYADAREKFQRASEEDRRFDQPLYNLALSYIRQKDWNNAVDALSRAISRNPNSADYHYQLGNAHYMIATAPENAENAQGASHLEQAKTAFTQALQKNNRLWMAQMRLGQIAELLDNPQDALRAYTDCINITPRAYAAYVRLARIYRDHGRYDEALQVLREGLNLAVPGTSERGQMYNVMGLTHLRQSQRPQAIEAFRHAVEADTRLVSSLFSLGMTYAELPDGRAQALLYLGQFVAARGGDAPAEYLAQATAKIAELQTAQ
ncbi:MAG: tetratricopeptide repeat protein [Deltaproteobacteria bacterium]|nr:tetratricopeptide repeat protein [Deltaproteobacteria bacterium]